MINKRPEDHISLKILRHQRYESRILSHIQNILYVCVNSLKFQQNFLVRYKRDMSSLELFQLYSTRFQLCSTHVEDFS